MKKRECEKEIAKKNNDNLSNVKTTLNERNKRIKMVQVKGLIIALVIAIIAIVTMIGVKNSKLELNSFETKELSVVKEYEELKDGEDVLEETENVQFSAFFLRDIDNDEELEKLKGTCKKIGEEDILYMDLKLNGGQLKDGKIEINNKNFFMQTALSKDEIIKNDYHSDNTIQIELNDLDNNAQKLILGKVRSGNYENSDEIVSALNQNINNYSRKDNKIIFTAKYVKDGKEFNIRKEIDIAVDWYLDVAQEESLKLNCEVEKRLDENNKVTYEISLDSKEISGNLLIKNNKVSGVIPQRNFKNPIDVKVKNEEVDFKYNQYTREFEIIDNASTDENGEIVKNVSVENKYVVEVCYENSVSETEGDSEQITVDAETEIYNNNNNAFKNPLKVGSTMNVNDTVGVAETQVDLNYVIWYIQNDNYPTQENVVRVEYSTSSLEPPYIPVNEGDINITDWYNNLAFYRINVDGGYIQDGVEYETFSELIDFIPDQIKTGSIVSVFYETPKTVQYNVEYYKEGVFVESELVSKKVAKSETGPFKINISDFNSSKYKGYKLDTASVPASVADGGTIKLEYIVDESQTKNLWYQIWYSKNGNMPESGQSVTVNKTVLEVDSDYAPVEEGDINITDRLSGYIFSGINVDGKYMKDGTIYDSYSTYIDYLPDSILTGSFVTVLYETPKSVSYNVEYYKDGVLQSSDTETISTQIAKSKTTIKVDSSNFSSKKYKGYKLDTTSIPETVEAGGTIKLQYVFDETQTKELTYTLWYMLNGNFPGTEDVVHHKLTKHVTESDYIPVNDGDINIEDWFSGYVFYNMNIDGGYIIDGVEHTTVGEDITFIPDEIKSGTIIMVNYETAKVANYSVEYYKDGVLQSDDTYRYSTYVAKSHDGVLTVDKSKINLTDKYYGYKTTTTIPDTVASGTTIKVYYEVDPSQTKEMTYTVEFYKNGVLSSADTISKVKTVQVLENYVEVDKEEINIVDKYYGYKYDYIMVYFGVGVARVPEPTPERWDTIPDEVTEGTYLRVYYVTDESQTKDLSYTVEYYKDNVLVTEDTQVVKNTVQVLQSDTMTVDESQINVEDKYLGYEFSELIKVQKTRVPELEGTENNPIIPDMVNSGTTIQVYYVKRTDLSYTVNYLEQDTNKVLYTSKVVNNQTYLSLVTETARSIYGYDFVNETETIEITTGDNVINFYYTAKNTFYYVINYKDKATDMIVESSKVVKNVTYGQTYIEEYIDVEGYNPDGDQIEITVTSNGLQYDLYYTARSDLSYTVEYYFNGTKDDSLTEIYNNQTYGTKASIYTDKVKTGYKFNYDNTPINIGLSNNVIKVYYTIDNTQTKELSYTLNFYKDSYDNLCETLEFKQIVQVLDEDIITVDKNVEIENRYEGYYFKQIDSTRMDIATYVGNGPVVLYELPTEVYDGAILDVLYNKRTDLSYVVNYLNQNTGEVLANCKFVENQKYEDVITESAIEIYGYNSVNSSETLTIGIENNVINFYYTPRTDAKYNVYYLDKDFDGNWDVAPEKHVTDAVYGQEYIEYAPEVDGFTIEEKVQTVIPTNCSNPTYVFFYYTRRSDLTYRVEYYYNGVKDDSLTEVFENQVFEAQISTYTDKVKDGYKLESATPIRITTGENVLKVYYVTDDTQTKELSYTIEFYKDYSIVPEDTLTFTKTVQVLEEDVIEVDKENIEINNKYEGYNFIEIIADMAEISTYALSLPLEELPSEVYDGAILEVYYEKRTDLSYVVNYLETGTNKELAESKTVENQTYQDVVTENAIDIFGYTSVNKVETITINLDNNSINFYYTPRTDFKYTIHYVDGDTNEDISTPKVVENAVYGARYIEDAIEIEGYVIDDPSTTVYVQEENKEYYLAYKKRTDLSYTIEYYYNGMLDDSLTEIINNQTFKAEVSTYTDKIKEGYKFEKATAPITIGISNNVIRVYYVTDDAQTKTISYRIDYYRDGVHIDSDVDTRTVQLLSPEVIDVDKARINTEGRYEGYYCTSTDPKEIPDTINNGGIIKVYYEPRIDLSYRVEYYFNGTIDESLTEVINNQTFGNEVSSYPDKLKEGYRFESATTPITIGMSNNVIRVYYVTDDAQTKTISYTIDYYRDGVHVDSDVDTRTVQLLAPEVIEVDKARINTEGRYEGYYCTSTNPEVIPDILNNGESIKVYYEKRTDLSYVVNYLEVDTDKVLAESKVVNNQTYLDDITERAIDIYGYVKDNTEKMLTINVSNNEINFYYSPRTDFTFSVNYIDVDTKEKIIPSILRKNCTYGLTYTEAAPGIEGYTINNSTKNIEMLQEDGEITFEYKKRNDLSYEVHYINQNNGVEIAETKIANNQIYLDTVTENAIDIFGYTAVNIEETITVDVENNVINFYYTPRTDFKYTIHYVDGDTKEDITTPKVIENAVFGENYIEDAIEVEGYVIDDPAINVNVTEDNKEYHLQYKKRTDLSYTVEYYFDGVIDESLTEIINNQTFKTEITKYADKIKAGYKLESADVPLVIGVNENVIKVYYVVDDTQTKEVSYKVEYYKNNVLDTTLVDSKTVQLLDSEIIEVNNELINTQDKFDGYAFVKTEPEIIPEVVNNGDVIKVYYEVRKDLSYVVNYLEEGTDKALADSKYVENKMFEEVVTEVAIDITGYRKDVKPKTITITTSENIINFYYSKMNDLEYVVKYLEEGTNKVLSTEKVVKGQIYLDEVKESAIDIEGYIKVNPTENKVIDVAGNEIVFYYKKVEGLVYKVLYLEKDTEDKIAEEKVVDGNTFEDEISEIAIDIEGYNKEEPTVQTIVIGMNENVIKFYYTRRTDLSYTVKYIDKDTQEEIISAKVQENQVFNTEITEKAIEVEGYRIQNPEETIIIGTGLNEIIFNYQKLDGLSYKVQYLEKDTNVILAEDKVVDGKIFKDEISEIAIDIDGYNKEEPTVQNIVIGINENVIKFYYTKRSDLSYIVKYVDQDTQEEIMVASVKEGMVFGTIVTEKAPEIEGYSIQNNEESITIGTGLNEIIFYYKKVEGLTYKVQYLEKDTNIALAEEKIVEGNKYKDEISEVAIDINGYECENTLETIVIGMNENIIKFYYIKKTDLTYRVEYYYDGVIDDSKTEMFENQKYQTVIDSYENKVIDGYKFDRVENIPLIIDEDENVIRVYYVRDEFEYRIEYYYDGVLDETNTVIGNARFKDVIDTYVDKVKDDFVLDRVENIPLEITSNSELNIIRVYYATNVFSYRINYYYDNVINPNETIVQKGVVGEEIVDYQDKIKPGYELDRVENLPLVITKNTEENVIDVYYKAKKSTIIVKYVDKDNGNELISEKVIEGKVFEKYDLENVIEEINGYTLIEKPESMNVEFIEETKEYMFYYSKNAQVIIKYLEDDETPNTDEDNTLLEEITINGYVGKDYMTVNKNFETYNFERSSENTTGKMTEEIIIVKYYYSKIKYGIVEKHVDVKTNEILASNAFELAIGENYKIEPKEIEGYDVVNTMLPENAEGVVKDEPIEVIYYYIRKTSVKVEYIDLMSEIIIANDVIEGHEGDEYSTEPKVIENYILDESKLPENAEGRMDVIINDDGTVDTETVVRYYYIAQAKVIEKHIDIKSNRILKEVVHEGFEGKDYITDKKEFKGYDFVEERFPENAAGTMTKEIIEVEYYYIRKASVRVEHLDVETGELLIDIIEIDDDGDGKVDRTEEIDPNIVIYGHEGDEYKVTYHDFRKYKLDQTKLPQNTEGTMMVIINEDGSVDSETVVRFYYIHKVEVHEKHIDIKTGKEIEQEIIHEGNEGDEYNIPNKEYDGYDLVEEKKPNNSEGTMGKEVVEVKYYYIRRTKVVVEYVDKDTGEIVRETKEIEGHEGDEYITEELEIEGYEISKEQYPENKEGTMEVVTHEDGTVETITYVRYYYEKVGKTETPDVPEGPETPQEPEIPQEPEEKPIEPVIKKGKVIVRFLERGTNKVLSNDIVYEGNVGEEYKTNSIDIEHYTLDHEPNNKSGKYTENTIIVTYYYYFTNPPVQTPVTITPSDSNNKDNIPSEQDPYDGLLPDTGIGYASRIIVIVVLFIIVINLVLIVIKKNTKEE